MQRKCAFAKMPTFSAAHNQFKHTQTLWTLSSLSSLFKFLSIHFNRYTHVHTHKNLHIDIETLSFRSR